MSPLADGLLLLVGGVATGIFGSLLGLGGGVLIVPLLTLVMGFPLLTAVGVSLICVIVTSGAAAGVYLERRVANLRLGMTLELFTASGALVGGLIAFAIPERVLEGAFTVLLAYTALTMVRRREAPAAADANVTKSPDHAGPPTFVDRLSGSDYRIRAIPAAVVGSIGAGVASALLGIGGGLIKVPLMHVVMGVPLRVATATSNLMIGITASASAIVYLLRGGIHAFVAAPTAIGVFIGATIGSRIAPRVDLRLLRGLFVVVLLYTAFQMLMKAIA